MSKMKMATLYRKNNYFGLRSAAIAEAAVPLSVVNILKRCYFKNVVL